MIIVHPKLKFSQIQLTLDISNRYLKVPSDIEKYTYILETIFIFFFISTLFILNCWYLKVNFLGPENLL